MTTGPGAGWRRALVPAVLVTAMAAPSLAVAQQARLDRLAADYWQATLDRYPERATLNGFPGERNGRLTDLRPAAFEAHDTRLRELLRGTAEVDPAPLPAAARTDLAMLQAGISNELAGAACHRELWEVNQQSGPQVALPTLAELQPVATPEDRERLLQRWKAIPAYLDQAAANLALGRDSGLVAPRINVERVLAQLDRLIAATADSSPLMAPAARARGDAAFAGQLRSVVADEIIPALRRYRALLKDQILPSARADVGISALPGGTACYRSLIRVHTSLDLGADEIHGIGLEAVSGIRQEMLAIARHHFGTSNLDSLIVALRTDPRQAFTSRQEVFNAAVAATRRMEQKLPTLFGRLPRRRLVVERMPRYQEADAPSGYYFPGTPDGSRPGRYLINTYNPPSRPRFTAEVLAFHEGVPGHHLQIALAQELALPDFRRYGDGQTAYVEGWALYTERLADEAGVYSGEVSRLGMLAFQSWRACRLVVDTGIHALGWSRQEAIDYLLRNVPLSRLDIENEVDRYIADPAQALGYLLGEREILRLREAARLRLGTRFDLRQFHDLVLGSGPVTLPILDSITTRWNPQPR